MSVVAEVASGAVPNSISPMRGMSFLDEAQSFYIKRDQDEIITNLRLWLIAADKVH